MSLISPDEVTELMAPGVSGEALQGLIDREEDWLANDTTVGIGALEGERSQTVYRPGGSSEPIFLPRPTATVDVTDAGAAADALLLGGGSRVEPVRGRWIGPEIVLTYTPNDLLRVKGVLLELIRLRISEAPFAQESSQGHAYSRGPTVGARRKALARGLHAQLGLPHSVGTHERPLISSR